MQPFVFQWAYSRNDEEREEILENIRTTTQCSSLTIDDPAQIIRPKACKTYIEAIHQKTDATTPVVPKYNELPQTVAQWVNKYPTVLHPHVSYEVDGEIKTEQKADPDSYYAEELRNLLLDRAAIKVCELNGCGQRIIPERRGIPQRFCSNKCRARHHREKSRQEHPNKNGL